MLKRCGYGKAVDWYLLGVVMYEFLVGIPPYYASNRLLFFVCCFFYFILFCIIVFFWGVEGVCIIVLFYVYCILFFLKGRIIPKYRKRMLEITLLFVK